MHRYIIPTISNSERISNGIMMSRKDYMKFISIWLHRNGRSFRACCTVRWEGTACISVSSRSVKKRKSTGHFIPCFAILTALWAAISAENTICIPNGNNSSWIVTFRSSTIRDMHRRKEKETWKTKCSIPCVTVSEESWIKRNDWARKTGQWAGCTAEEQRHRILQICRRQRSDPVQSKRVWET